MKPGILPIAASTAGIPPASASSAGPPAHVQVVQMATGYWISRAVYAAARLGLADLLGGGTRSARELADATQTHAPSLYRLLRALASLGLFTESDGHCFALTALGATLKTGAPGAARSTVMALAGQWMWGTWNEFLYSLQTGKTAFEKVWGMPVFDFLGKHPDEARLFGDAMIGVHGEEPAAVAAAYDFSDIRTVVDVGGGTGNLLTTILRSHGHLTGVLYDRVRPSAGRRAPFRQDTRPRDVGRARRCRAFRRGVRGLAHEGRLSADAHRPDGVGRERGRGGARLRWGACA